MRRLIGVLVLLLAIAAHGEDGLSPIDEKYAARSPDLFVDVLRARELLDSWNGNGQKLADAYALLEGVLGTDTGFAPAWLEYGRLLQKAGYISGSDYDPELVGAATEAILMALELEPKYPSALSMLAATYINTRKYDDAKAALAQAEAIGSNDLWLHINWAVIHLREGDQHAALERYLRVVESGDRGHRAYATALGGIAKIQQEEGHLEEAKSAYEQKIEIDPGNAWNWGNYSRFLLFYYDDVDGAIANGQKALSIMNYGMGRLVLACALYTKWARIRDDPDRADAAQALFDEAGKLYPDMQKVIRATRQFEVTRTTATELARWLNSSQARP